MAITSVNVASAITKLVAADALPALVGNLVMGNLVTRDYEPTVAQAGDVVDLPMVGGIARIILNTHCQATFQVPDVTKVLAVPDLLQIYMRRAVCELTDRIERDLLGLHAGFTAHAPVGATGVPITEDVVDQADTALFMKATARDSQFLLVDAFTYSRLRHIPRFSEYQNAGEAGLRTLVDGSVGKIRDFFVFRSQFIAQSKHAPISTYNLAFTKDAIGFASRRPPQRLPVTGMLTEYAELGNFGMAVTMRYQPNTLTQEFSLEILYGTEILRNSHGVQVLS